MKKRIIKTVGIVLIVIILGIAGLLTYVKAMLPNTGPAPDLKISQTPERVKRGEYLVNHVMLCVDCHSARDFSLISGPIMPGSEGGGGEAFDHAKGLPGDFYAKNITPYGLGSWTDGEIYRAVTTGVNKDGKALFPLMPYEDYGKMDTADIYAVIAYLRTMKPIKKDIPASHADFPMNFIINTIPHKGAPQSRPDTSNLVAYGAYMVNASACSHCHTQSKQGKPIGEPFMGGSEIHLPGGIVRTANITPDVETGIGAWSENDFVQRFKYYQPGHLSKAGGFNTIMPWSSYSGMDSSDLKAIYAYLRTVKPVKNHVLKFSPKETAQ